MSEQPGEPREIVPAATVVIFRNCQSGGPPEILMVTRSRNMSFAGGMAVFPGGRVDPEDFDLARQLAPGDDADEIAHRVAGMRETLEETGLALALQEPVDAREAAEARKMLLEQRALAPVLEAFGWSLDLDALVPFARWLPKFAHERVFDTRFYLANLGTGAVDIEVDATENTKLFWVSAKDALAKAEAGEIGIIFPTQRNLERLAQFDDFPSARAHAEGIPVRTITPFIVEEENERWLGIPDDLGYPVTREKITSAMRG